MHADLAANLPMRTRAIGVFSWSTGRQNDELLPPTMGTTVVDPRFDLDVVRGDPRPWDPAPAMSNSFAFGGHNGTLVFSPV